MEWYSKIIKHDGQDILMKGTFKDSIIRVTANGHQLYEKSINFWTYQEVYAEDILNKYEGIARKCEKKVALLVDSGIISSKKDNV